jgi:hypothetical protein
VDVWTNAVFWTLLVNCTAYVFISLISKQSSEETALAECCVKVFDEQIPILVTERRMIRVGTVDELEATLARYVGSEKARTVVDFELVRMKTTRDKLDAIELLKLRDCLERILTGSVGPSATRIIVEEEVSVKPVAEVAKDTVPVYELHPCRVYMIPQKAYEVFTDQITHGIEGLCITTSDPEEIRKRWGFTETPIIRLSHVRGRGERDIAPINLPLLFITIKSYVEKSKNSIILLDSLEFLIKENLGIVPEAEILDFVYSIEKLSHNNRTRIVLPDRPLFAHRPPTAEISEVRQLIFMLGPLSAYLFKVFANLMLSGLDERSRQKITEDVNAMKEADSQFEGVTYDGNTIEVDPNVKFTRRHFFESLMYLERIIQKVDPSFKLKTAVEPSVKKYGLSPYEISLRPGTTYVLEEEKPIKSLEIFGELVHYGVDGLCISRYHPEKLQEQYHIPTERVIWLTQTTVVELKYRCVDPTNLPRLSSMISDFLHRSEDPLILLEGLGYLITQSNYESILRFIQSQRDEIALQDAIFLIHIDPLALDTKELHMLKSEMEPLKT